MQWPGLMERWLLPMAKAFYNEIDPFKAEVLRQAIKAGAIADGDVDERSIADVQPGDLAGYTQCHFFAGGGFWSLALRNAGWPDDRPVWTGSCPCPSFSAAGKGAGFSDPRHLWPDWMRLIRECRPAIILGEQVSAAIGHGWLDLVQDDLEAEDYAVGKAVLGACCIGAPHIRQRLYFVADSEHFGCGRQVRLETVEDCDQQEERISNGDCAAEFVANTDRRRREQRNTGLGTVSIVGENSQDSILGNAALGGLGIAGSAPGSAGHADLADESLRMGEPIRAGLEGHGGDGGDGNQPGRDGAEQVGPATEAGESGGVADVRGIGRGRREGATQRHESDGEDAGRIEGDGGPECGDKDAGRMADTPSSRRQRESEQRPAAAQREVFCAGELGEQSGTHGASIERPGPVNGFWRDADWIGCRDGKWRPVEPGTFPLAHGSTARVGRLRMYGDGIVVPVAQAFIEAVKEVVNG